ncbi:hypothetical protein ACN47E_004686 [Coniothyrium glycines]
MSAVLQMPSFSSSPYGLQKQNVESFAPAFTSVNGKPSTSPTNEQKLPFPVNTRTPPVRPLDNGYRSSSDSASPHLSSGDISPASPNKRRHAESEDDSYVKISPVRSTTLSPNQSTATSRFSPAQYHSAKLPSMDNPQQRTLPPLDCAEAERRWATEPREMPHNGYQELQPRENRLAESTPGAAQGPTSNVTELFTHEQTIGTELARSGMQAEPKRRKRQFANRTKTGCGTCRRRKKKCDEAKPQCNNCHKGGFICEGYAIKVPWPKNGVTKPPPPLQAKERSSAEIASVYARCPACNQVHIPHCETPRENSKASYQSEPHAPNAPEGARSRPITVEEHERKPPAPSNWSTNTWSEALPPRASYQTEGPPPTQYPPAQAPRDAPPAPPQNHQVPLHQQSEPPRPLSHRIYHHALPSASQSVASTPVPAMVANAAAHHHQVPQLSRQAASTTAPPAPPPTHYVPPPIALKSEKAKMLAGEPFLPFDRQLVDERNQCTSAVFRFNDTSNGAVNITETERGRLFKTIVAARWIPPHTTVRPVVGHYGGNVHVAAPFHCDYGYNLSIADNVVIGSNCQLLDAARICIGRNTKIGARVLISTIKTPTDPKALKGSNGTELAQEVWIGENVYIGDGCIIEAGVKIGDGAVVRPGSVVVRDLPRECVAHGNPAFG